MNIFNFFSGRKKELILLTEIRNILANMCSLMSGLGADEIIAASNSEPAEELIEIEKEKIEGWE